MVVQLVSRVLLFATSWPALCRASLSFTVSQSLLKLMSIESMIPSKSLILCCSLLLLPSFKLFQHQGLFQWVSSLYQVTKVLEVQLQHQSFQWIFRVDFLSYWLVWSPCSPWDSQESSPAPQFKRITLAFSLLWNPTLKSVHDYWKNHSFDNTQLCQQSDASTF